MKSLKELGYEVLPLSALKKADWNYKEDDDEQLKKLKANIKRNNQIENLIVRVDGDQYEIVNGNHRYDALKELGIGFAVVNNLGKISKAAAMRIAIETNETRFKTDTIELSEVMKLVSEEFPISELIETMPYTEEDLNDLVKMADFDWDQFKANEAIDEGKFAYSIEFENEEQKQEFMNLLNEKVTDKSTAAQVLISALK